MERTLVIVKPDAINRNLAGEITSRFERKGLKIVAMKMQSLQPYVLKEHYAHHKDKAFYGELIRYMSSIPCILMILQGKEAVKVVRKLVGGTQGREAEPGTIRGDYSVSNQTNLVHASDSVETANTEIKRFFSEKEICDYQKMDFDWVYSKDEKYLAKK
ncbi:MAG: nucleoside-diphosphate kinase [Candidatus Diapherotrites archaeon]|nr:nucleoside-diphosphate kinase [Candidatus Diapherotrites archaeon]